MPGKGKPNRVFAPLNIPLERRLQTGALALWLLALPLSLLGCFTICSVMFTFWELNMTWSFNVGAVLCALYMTHVCTDRRWKRDGARMLWLMRTQLFLRLSQLFCNFFPTDVTWDALGDDSSPEPNMDAFYAVFSPTKNYLMCAHPHGVFGYGVWATFVANNPATNRYLHEAALGKQRRFDVTVHTMSVNFRIPWWREFLMFLGFCDVDRRTLLHGLARRMDSPHRRGRICVLVPGGAAESIDCTVPLLTLKKRKGFVKIALETGCDLVPVFTFGETDLYKPLLQRAGAVRKFLFAAQKFLGIGMPLVCGRGIFNYSVGFLPHREPLHTVIGKPISVPLRPRGSYTDADVDAIHTQYVDAVRELYTKYQPIFAPDTEHKELKIR